eukprot:5755856-Amphidinium_carterae.1
MGVDGPLPADSIFPQVDGPSAAVLDSMDFVDEGVFDDARHQNYAPFEEAGVKRIWPNAIASKIAVIVKPHPDSDKVKVRFVMDFKRSGVNSKVQVAQRVPLPRASDLRDSILAAGAILESVPYLATVDFSDAFLNLERGHACNSSLFPVTSGLGCLQANAFWYGFSTFAMGQVFVLRHAHDASDVSEMDATSSLLRG